MLVGYSSSDDESDVPASFASRTLGLTLLSAPPVDSALTAVPPHNNSTLSSPPQGPANPFRRQHAVLSAAAVDDAGFDEQVHSSAAESHSSKSSKSNKSNNSRRTKRPKPESLGPWSSESYHSDANSDDDDTSVPQEQKQYLEDLELKREETKRKRKKDEELAEKEEESKLVQKDELAKACESTLHASAEFDYQGRSWAVPPATLRPREPASQESRIPKRLAHVWKGHSKGVQAIEFFPKYAHLLLSGSLDTTCKIWGCYEAAEGGSGRELKRSYNGHSKPIKAICFDTDGAVFASSGYDKKVVIWDVETGQPNLGWHVGATANAVKFFPNDNNIILAACSNRKILQFDRREGKVVQQYHHHLEPVNTLTFFDENRRFISTSDDKKLLAWEMNIPVPMKYIQGPSMQSMPVVRHHPTEDYVVCQSMDNQILTFEAGEKVRADRKVFTGHNNAGYACGIDFSPNGRYLMSGDSGGKLFFWDWKSCRKFRELQVHDKFPCFGAIWHPIEPSWVATCSWDGLIKLWE